MAANGAEKSSHRSPNHSENSQSLQLNGSQIHSRHRGHGSFSASTNFSPTSTIGGEQRVLNSLWATQSSQESESGNAVAELSVQKSVIHRLDAAGSVQALVVNDDVLFAGLEGGEVVAWSLETYEQLARVYAHHQSVLSLALSDDGSLLFSCGIDSVVNVWSTASLKRIYSLRSFFEIGDIFSVTYSQRTKTLFCGAQNTSIQWQRLESHDDTNAMSFSSSARRHRFFDSTGPGGVPSPKPSGNVITQGGIIHTIPASNYQEYAHKGFIYSMLLANGLTDAEPEQEILVTAGGGGTIKMWSIQNLRSKKLQLINKFKNSGSSVFSLAYRAPFLHAGLSRGVSHVYNLSSQQLVHKVDLGCGDILQVQIWNDSAIHGTSTGLVKRISNRFAEVDRWTAHRGKILATGIVESDGRTILVSGGNDNKISFWNISNSTTRAPISTAASNDELVNMLRQLVSYRTVSRNPNCVSECHQAATFLRKQFSSFGAVTKFISPQDGVNPILLARFIASIPDANTVLFYGHYDVIDADPINGWHADPFTLHPLNGYLYGRGVTDNKGPILAALFAVAELAHDRSLSCNVVFVLEGDEEAGSRGFQSAIQEHKRDIGHVDYILLSNSYWLDDHIPCLTWGMRGVVHCKVDITSNRGDLHSGVDGKALQHEPLKDLTVLLGTLIGRNGTDINIPYFYDTVDELQASEQRAYSSITSALGTGHPEILDEQAFMKSLMQKWRDPNLTIHQIHVPESQIAVTISKTAQATFSIRIVPSQSADQVAEQLERYLWNAFSRLGSTNEIDVKITSRADPWLGQISSEIYSVLREAVIEAWSSQDVPSQRSFLHDIPAHGSIEKPSHRRGSSLFTTGTFTPSNTPREPLFIREGGSIPAISFLEREFGAPAAMFPMGQASDNAHLVNERMRLENLYKGREVLKKVFARL